LVEIKVAMGGGSSRRNNTMDNVKTNKKKSNKNSNDKNSNERRWNEI